MRPVEARDVQLLFVHNEIIADHYRADRACVPWFQQTDRLIPRRELTKEHGISCVAMQGRFSVITFCHDCSTDRLTGHEIKKAGGARQDFPRLDTQLALERLQTRPNDTYDNCPSTDNSRNDGPSTDVDVLWHQRGEVVCCLRTSRKSRSHRRCIAPLDSGMTYGQ